NTAPSQPQGGSPILGGLKIRLGWAEYRHGRWTNKQASTKEQFINSTAIGSIGGIGPQWVSDPKHFSLQIGYQPQPRKLILTVSCRTSSPVVLFQASFRFSVSEIGEASISPSSLDVTPWIGVVVTNDPSPKGTAPDGNRFLAPD